MDQGPIAQSRAWLAVGREITETLERVDAGAFERFVFVMSVLEGHSEQECAILLGCSRRDVTIARVLALARLANTDADYSRAGEVMQS